MRENKNPRGVFGKGYYIALILCAAAIGITSYVYYRNAGEETALEASAPSEQSREDVAVIADIVIAQSSYSMADIHVIEV